MNAATEFDVAAIDNPEAEQALLGALMLNNDALTVVRSMLKPEYFFEPIHRNLFTVIVQMVDKGDQATPITVRPFLGAADEKVGEITLGQYLARLVVESTGVYSVKGQAKAVVEAWQRRMIVAECRDTIKRACEANVSDEPASIVAELGDRIVDIVNAGSDAKKSRQYGDLLHAAMRAVQQRRNDASGLIHWFLPELNDVVGPIRPGNLIGLMSDSGGGKGQPLDAPILTPWGYKPMGELKVGSVITSADGSPTKVIGVFPLGERDIFRVSFGDGTSTEVTDDHLWLGWLTSRNRLRDGGLQCGKDVAKLYTTRNLIDRLAKGQASNIRIPVCQPISFIAGAASRYRAVPPYTLGALLGDGCFRNTSLTITSADLEVVHEIELELGTKLVPPGERKHERTPAYCVPFSTGVKSELVRLGLWGLKSADKFIPPNYLLASVPDRWRLLQGLLDTDGSVKRNGTAEFMTKSDRLAADVASLARSLGAVVTVAKRATSYRDPNGNVIDCGLGNRVMIKLPDLAMAFALPRKKALCGVPQSMSKRIVSIEQVRRAEAQCIKVDHPSSLYVTDDFIVTHNTSFSALQCRFAAESGVATAFFSIEITEDEAALQMAAQRIGVSMGEIDEWQLLSGKLEALVKEEATGSRLPLVIEGFAEANVPEIRSRILMLKKRMGLQFVMIDHAKMIDLPGRGNDLFAERVNRLYRELKAIAKATGVAIVILIQRNDDWKKRPSPRPVPSDAYGGGSVKQNLDVFFSLYRPEPLLMDLKAVEHDGRKRDDLASKLEQCRGLAWIINHKRRRGEPMKTERVRFDAEFTTFKSDRETVDLPPELAF